MYHGDYRLDHSSSSKFGIVAFSKLVLILNLNAIVTNIFSLAQVYSAAEALGVSAPSASFIQPKIKIENI